MAAEVIVGKVVLPIPDTQRTQDSILRRVQVRSWTSIVPTQKGERRWQQFYRLVKTLKGSSARPREEYKKISHRSNVKKRARQHDAVIDVQKSFGTERGFEPTQDDSRSILTQSSTALESRLKVPERDVGLDAQKSFLLDPYELTQASMTSLTQSTVAPQVSETEEGSGASVSRSSGTTRGTQVSVEGIGTQTESPSLSSRTVGTMTSGTSIPSLTPMHETNSNLSSKTYDSRTASTTGRYGSFESVKTARSTWSIPEVEKSLSATQLEFGKELAMQRAYTEGLQVISENRRVYIIRHAERMDRIFPEWIKMAFDDEGRYIPYDSNQPTYIPERRGGPTEHFNDAPITVMGDVTAALLGRSMNYQGVVPAQIYSSPALRCVQTALTLSTRFEQPVPVCIEPGLFEWIGWYKKMPKFMSPSELKQVGYNIAEDYEPVMSMGDLLASRRESIPKAYARIARTTDVLLRALQPSGDTPKDILIVGHAMNLDAGPQGLLLTNTSIPSELELNRLGLKYPYCATVVLEQLPPQEGNIWKLMENPTIPLSYLDYSNNIDSHFFTRMLANKDRQQ